MINKCQAFALTCLTLFTLNAHAQCTITSTEGYTVTVGIFPTHIVVSSSDCPWGYNYNVGFDYLIEFDGPAPPSAMYSMSTSIGCGGESNDAVLPVTESTGSMTTTSNHYVPFVNGPYDYGSRPDCTGANLVTMNCGTVTVSILGPGISYQTVDCNPYTALPVELVSFSGEATDEQVELRWLVASEKQNDYFSVLHSSDGISWSPRCKIQGRGDASDQKEYRWTDSSPVNGVNYYKLVQTGTNGASKDLDIKAVEFVVPGMLKSDVYPNPANDGKCTMRVVAKKDSDIRVQLCDPLGRMLRSVVMHETGQQSSYTVFTGEIVLDGNNPVFAEVFQNNIPVGRHLVLTGKEAR